MYVLNITYSVDPAQVAPHKKSHSMWVKHHIDQGDFLCAGPKSSGLGGVIVTKTMAKKELLAILAQDSFVEADVADYHITDFLVKLADPSLSFLLPEQG